MIVSPAAGVGNLYRIPISIQLAMIEFESRYLQRIAGAIVSLVSMASLATDQFTHQALFAPNTSYPYFESNSFPKEAKQDVFDLRVAGFLAEASLLVYVKDPKFIETTLDRAGFPESRFFENHGTYAFLAINDHNLILVFRGSETADKTDYTTDAKIIQTPFREFGSAHSGFVEALDWVNEAIEEEINQLLVEKPRALWISGHSLGGALATLYGIHHSDQTTAVYTIGAPRVGGINLAQEGEERIRLYRLVNDNDIIPRLPTPPFYRHFGTIHFITSEGELIEDPHFTRQWESRANGHAALIEKLYESHWKRWDFKAIPLDYVVDHSPRLYAEALVRALQSEP